MNVTAVKLGIPKILIQYCALNLTAPLYDLHHAMYRSPLQVHCVRLYKLSNLGRNVWNLCRISVEICVQLILPVLVVTVSLSVSSIVFTAPR